ncbi:MAG: hypothetical protein MH112_13335 [Phenylobacterium sp.]|uniref:hypothetical protein n=1 Tax=Phenylobacterium sp. TaxID=1871053 RepID=UPI0025E20C6B|nr:hypothetical protein [Phenylobacterium sp.]MCG9917326.1 hypothetical protein [Phenylobacterium sp.]
MSWIALRASAAATCAVLLASPALGQDVPLKLDLVCSGQYADAQMIMHPGSARISILGDVGTLVYPDGRQRFLRNVAADPNTIKADYAPGAPANPPAQGQPQPQTNRLTGNQLLQAFLFEGLGPEQAQRAHDERLRLQNLTWRLDIDRMTGDIRIVSDGAVGFMGVCEAAPTVAKF